MKKIKLTIGSQEFVAELYDTPTAEAIYATLPYSGASTLWGDEIYFSIPLQLEQEADAREVVEPGQLGFWPVGSAFCIFFGSTPVSTDDRPRAYSPVNVFGMISGSLENLKKLKAGDAIRVETV